MESPKKQKLAKEPPAPSFLCQAASQLSRRTSWQSTRAERRRQRRHGVGLVKGNGIEPESIIITFANASMTEGEAQVEEAASILCPEE